MYYNTKTPSKHTTVELLGQTSKDCSRFEDNLALFGICRRQRQLPCDVFHTLTVILWCTSIVAHSEDCHAVSVGQWWLQCNVCRTVQRLSYSDDCDVVCVVQCSTFRTVTVVMWFLLYSAMQHLSYSDDCKVTCVVQCRTVPFGNTVRLACAVCRTVPYSTSRTVTIAV